MTTYHGILEKYTPWQYKVKDKDLSSPPASPTNGDRYIVGASATGDWVGHDDDIAYYNGSSWGFISPSEGWITYVSDESKHYKYNGSTWEAWTFPASRKEISFTDSDLSSGVLTFNHNLGTQYVVIVIYDDSDEQVVPDTVDASGSNSASIDLSSFGTLTGTWHAVAVGKAVTTQRYFTWSIKTAAYTLVAGDAVFSDTSSSALTHTLPSNPSLGDAVIIKDYKDNAGTNNITIGRNGENINGSASDFVIDTDGAGVKLVYSDSTEGWITFNYG